MIIVENVQPTAREFRHITGGWGAMHWLCIPYTYAFLAGLLFYGLIASSLAEDVLPPFLFVGFVVGSYGLWFVSGWAVRRAAARAVARSPTGGLAWRWSIDADGIVFTNGLQTNQLDWRAVKSVRDESDRFLFLVTPAYNAVLPKRLLEEAQLTALRALIAEVTASGRLGRGVD